MPYINQDERPKFDSRIVDILARIDEDRKDGQLNYIISSLIGSAYNTNYKELNAAIGVLECAKQELYRRVAAPYEDTKIIQNGDVYGD